MVVVVIALVLLSLVERRPRVADVVSRHERLVVEVVLVIFTSHDEVEARAAG